MVKAQQIQSQPTHLDRVLDALGVGHHLRGLPDARALSVAVHADGHHLPGHHLEHALAHAARTAHHRAAKRSQVVWRYTGQKLQGEDGSRRAVATMNETPMNGGAKSSADEAPKYLNIHRYTARMQTTTQQKLTRGSSGCRRRSRSSSGTACTPAGSRPSSACAGGPARAAAPGRSGRQSPCLQRVGRSACEHRVN
jgi:hypothetical protein